MENKKEPSKRRSKKKTLTPPKSEGSSYKRITVEQLNDLGYQLTGRQFNMGNNSDNYLVLELRNEDNKVEVSFCYLYSREDKSGVILADTFSFCMKRYLK